MTENPGTELVHVTPMPIAEVEGEMIRRMEGKIPGLTLQMDYGYKRNTHLRLEVEVRVQSVLVDEIRGGPDRGQLVRRHNFAIEEVKIVGAYTAAQMEQGVGGSASASAVREETEDERRDSEPADGGPEPGVPGPGRDGPGGEPYPDF